MGLERYCIYNETNESFLSLGVTRSDGLSERLNEILIRSTSRSYQGSWIVNLRVTTTVGLLSPRDLIYLDGLHRVVHLIESFPRLRIAPRHPEAKSLLALPAGALESSQTKGGDQLVICVAEEMGARLRNTGHPVDSMCLIPSLGSPTSAKNRLVQEAEKDRRISRRARWPHLAAVESNGESFAAQAVLDISTTGLYLLTDERWPLGTRVRIRLQRTDALDDATMIPTTVEMRVSRWGDDGVGLEFIAADTEHSALVSMHVR